MHKSIIIVLTVIVLSLSAVACGTATVKSDPVTPTDGSTAEPVQAASPAVTVAPYSSDEQVVIDVVTKDIPKLDKSFEFLMQGIKAINNDDSELAFSYANRAVSALNQLLTTLNADLPDGHWVGGSVDSLETACSEYVTSQLNLSGAIVNWYGGSGSRSKVQKTLDRCVACQAELDTALAELQ